MFHVLLFVCECVCVYDTIFPFCNWTQNDYGDCIPKPFQNNFHRASLAIDLITRPLIIIQVAVAHCCPVHCTFCSLCAVLFACLRSLWFEIPRANRDWMWHLWLARNDSLKQNAVISEKLIKKQSKKGKEKWRQHKHTETQMSKHKTHKW